SASASVTVNTDTNNNNNNNMYDAENWDTSDSSVFSLQHVMLIMNEELLQYSGSSSFNMGSNNNNHNVLNKLKFSIHSSILQYIQFIKRLPYFYEEQNTALKTVVVAQIIKHRKDLKGILKDAEKEYQQIHKIFQQSSIVKDKADAQFKILVAKQIECQEKLDRTIKKLDAGGSSRQKLELRKQEMDQANQNIQDMTSRLEQIDQDVIERARNVKNQQLTQLMNKLRNAEFDRGEYLRWLIHSFVGHRRTLWKQVRLNLQNVKSSLDLSMQHPYFDLEMFILANSSSIGVPIPENVQRHLLVLSKWVGCAVGEFGIPMTMMMKKKKQSDDGDDEEEVVGCCQKDDQQEARC
ncbi:MAG: hypothetical protein KIT69_21585, partial [Propionibacteriaceae bacterium]|nr:hypothetical protein [Propionibacteriaceae bacterium]